MSYDTGDRLKEVAEALFDGNQSELARQLGMKPGSFSKYTSGKTLPGGRVLQKLSDLGVNLHWMLTGKGEMMWGETSPALLTGESEVPYIDTEGDISREGEIMSAVLDELGIRLVWVPHVRVEAEAGEGAVVYPSDEVEVGGEWMTETYIRRNYNVSPSRVKSMVIRGNSMVDTINPGDRIRMALWNGEPMWTSTIYVIRGPGGLTVKRWQGVHDDSVILQADNPEIEDKTIPQEQWDEQYQPVAWVLEVTKPL